MRGTTLVQVQPVRESSAQPGIHRAGPTISTGRIRNQMDLALSTLSEPNRLLQCLPALRSRRRKCRTHCNDPAGAAQLATSLWEKI